MKVRQYYSVYYRLTVDLDDIKAGEYFQRILGLNFLDVITKLKLAFGNDHQNVVVETITEKPFDRAARIVYDRDAVHF